VQEARARSRRRVPRIALAADMQGPLVAGKIPPTRAFDIGLIDSFSGGAEVVEHWFAGRPAFLYQMNLF
jgi:hypothetical protein